MFLGPNEKFVPANLAGLLVEEALLCGAEAVATAHTGDWWFVASSFDWLGDAAEDSFQKIMPLDERGPNAARFEVVLTAFASSVFTVADGKIAWIAGNEADAPPLPRFLGTPVRVVAFKP